MIAGTITIIIEIITGTIIIIMKIIKETMEMSNSMLQLTIFHFVENTMPVVTCTSRG